MHPDACRSLFIHLQNVVGITTYVMRRPPVHRVPAVSDLALARLRLLSVALQPCSSSGSVVVQPGYTPLPAFSSAVTRLVKAVDHQPKCRGERTMELNVRLKCHQTTQVLPTGRQIVPLP
eukprot:1582852-Rhodomonas_salina.1